jgi:hypothetical protein
MLIQLGVVLEVLEVHVQEVVVEDNDVIEKSLIYKFFKKSVFYWLFLALNWAIGHSKRKRQEK